MNNLNKTSYKTSDKTRFAKTAKLIKNIGRLIKDGIPGMLTDVPLITVHTIPGLVMRSINKWKKLIDNKEMPLVVLIHGTSVSSWQWGVVEQYLRNHNLESGVVDYDYTQDITVSVDDVKQQILELCKKRKHKKVVLVGHSQGGLISRLIYNTGLNEIKIEQNYSLHAPQLGAEIAKVRNDVIVSLGKIPSCSAYDMEPNSKFVTYYTNTCTDTDSFLMTGSMDFVKQESALWGQKDEDKIYRSKLGHYYPAVNYNLWVKFIIPNIKKSCSKVEKNCDNSVDVDIESNSDFVHDSNTSI